MFSYGSFVSLGPIEGYDLGKMRYIRLHGQVGTTGNVYPRADIRWLKHNLVRGTDLLLLAVEESTAEVALQLISSLETVPTVGLVFHDYWVEKLHEAVCRHGLDDVVWLRPPPRKPTLAAEMARTIQLFLTQPQQFEPIIRRCG